MQLHLHPTRREALTASDSALTRWSLETNPATILAQMSTAPESVFSHSYSPHGHLHTSGGITGTPDGVLFAHEHIQPERFQSVDPHTIEWRRWDDFSLARSTLLDEISELGSLAISPDSRWLVLESAEKLYLLDWRIGEIQSHHAIKGLSMTALTFDPTSTFIAGVLCSYDCDSVLHLWRLDSAERFVPRPAEEYWWLHDQPDHVSGSMALTLVYVDWDRIGIEWLNKYLADAPGCVTFSSDSRILLFSLHSSIEVGGCALVAFEMPSARLLWSTQHEAQSSGQPIFSPGSSTVLVPMQDGSILAYNAENGALVQRLPSGLSEPIQALAFDHDGRTLWLATEEALVQYQPKG